MPLILTRQRINNNGGPISNRWFGCKSNKSQQSSILFSGRRKIILLLASVFVQWSWCTNILSYDNEYALLPWIVAESIGLLYRTCNDVATSTTWQHRQRGNIDNVATSTMWQHRQRDNIDNAVHRGFEFKPWQCQAFLVNSFAIVIENLRFIKSQLEHPFYIRLH